MNKHIQSQTKQQYSSSFCEKDKTGWHATVLTLFPTMFPGPLGLSLAGKALNSGIWNLKTLDIRNFAPNKSRSVDDYPFGGGSGMVMRPDVVDTALEAVADRPGPRLYPSPRGAIFDQSWAKILAKEPGAVIFCGRYEGLDERVIKARKLKEVSIGDFVLSGGEPAALIIMDALIRLLPGVLRTTTALTEESFENGLLEYPLYTHPRNWNGIIVPEILTSGDHAKVKAWKRLEAESITRKRRPDLWKQYMKNKDK
ncbi:tRNA (guanine-N1)-methyltransferase [Candidatus Endolissoclinum faulkneri L5]|uniref:tRNA (guanine-N(1)-)-methyltransferase n=1 Tax=Candidatus Endolissoclinum faulkneri L5 TaxID=1401328 RepID=V9TVV6_9PROT|nr:tRNA (guanine-N1)-methyltransferase [Candidatus Endolissoclinum faulkneri L5]